MISGISNRHGTSWFRGVCFTFIVALLFFIYFNKNLSDPLFELGWNNMDSCKIAISDSFPKFIEFLYVGHSWDFMKDNNPNNLALLVDFIGRVIIGFGYYQTVAAFRKYGKM